MRPKLILCLALILSGGLSANCSGAKDATALFPITEIKLAHGFSLTNLAAAFTNDSAFGDLEKNVSFNSGFIDQSGSIVIPPNSNWWPAHVEEGHFVEGLEPVQRRWRPGMTYGFEWGYLDAKGKFAIEPQFSLALPFSEGLAAVRSLRGYGYIDHTGKYVIAPQFEYAFGFSEGLAEVVDTNHLMGFIDRGGKWVIKPQFRCFAKSSSFSEGLACVATNDVADKFPFDSNGTFPQFKWGYINKKGKQVIDFKFDEAAAFSEGLAAVNVNGTSQGGYIDKTGKFIIPPKFNGVWSFSEGLARVEMRGQMEFINRQGEVVFTVTNGVWADEFSDGLANVWLRKGVGGEIWGYIDHAGRFVIKPQFQQAQPFHHGLAQVVIDNKPAYIDKSGRYVWKQ